MIKKLLLFLLGMIMHGGYMRERKVLVSVRYIVK